MVPMVPIPYLVAQMHRRGRGKRAVWRWPGSVGPAAKRGTMKLPQSILAKSKVMPLPRRERMSGVVSFWMDLKTVASINGRAHPMERHRRVKNERTVTNIHMLQLGKLPEPPVEVRMTRWAPKELDDDNLRSALKSVRDEIAKVLGVDDGDTKRIRFVYHQRPGERPGYGVEVCIQSVGES